MLEHVSPVDVAVKEGDFFACWVCAIILLVRFQPLILSDNYNSY